MDAHTHRLQSSQDFVYILDHHELNSPPQNVKFCAGIHPWQISQYPHLCEAVLSATLHPKCVGIGETGLDRLYPELALQEASLLWHWDLAEERKKALILHLVKSSSDILALLKKRRPQTNWIWHDFQGPLEVIDKVLKLHPQCFFSFGPRAFSRPDSKHLWNQVPAHLRLIETDDAADSIEAVLKLSEASEAELSKNFHTAFSL